MARERFQIEVEPQALEDLLWFRKHEHVRIRAEIAVQLLYQPDKPSGKRKRLEPDGVAEWELRIGQIRVFYDVNRAASSVTVVRVGYKERSKLLFRGEEHLS